MLAKKNFKASKCQLAITIERAKSYKIENKNIFMLDIMGKFCKQFSLLMQLYDHDFSVNVNYADMIYFGNLLCTE